MENKTFTPQMLPELKALIEEKKRLAEKELVDEIGQETFAKLKAELKSMFDQSSKRFWDGLMNDETSKLLNDTLNNNTDSNEE